MVTTIPTIEPFTFQASTAFKERVQIADKLNEVIDAINQIGEIEVFQQEIDSINATIAQIQTQIGDQGTEINTLTGQINTLISDVNSLTTRVSAAETDIGAIEQNVSVIQTDIQGIDTEIKGLQGELISEIELVSSPHGSVQVVITHEDETQTTSPAIDLGLVQEGGITLQTGSTDRSFKLLINLTDGTSWQTNDFVIPEGGGTDVSITSISISQGTTADQIRFNVGLSDGSTIASNDWNVVTPTEFASLQSTVSGNTSQISSLNGRVTALEDAPSFTLSPATATQLGGVKIGAGIIVQSDGTIAVDKTQINIAAVASTLMFTADASKVTLHTDSVAGSEFTKDIPQASQGGAGTIDQESYAKIAATEAKVNALAPTVTVNNDVSPAQITVTINGKSSTANLPSGASTVNNAIVLLGSTTKIPSNLICEGAIPDTITKAETSRNLLDPDGIMNLYSTIVNNNPSPFIFKNIYAFFYSTQNEKSTTTLSMGGLKDSSGFNATREIIANKYYPITYNFSISCFENGLPSSKRYIRLSKMVLLSGAGDFKNEGDNSFTDVIFDRVERNFKVQYGMTASGNNFQLYFSPLTEAFLSDTDTF